MAPVIGEGELPWANVDIARTCSLHTPTFTHLTDMGECGRERGCAESAHTGQSRSTWPGLYAL
eukprot:3185750-Rhodomonas_salina.1